MSSFYFIKSLLDGDVIDVAGAHKTPDTPLDAFPQKQKDADNQLWNFEPSSKKGYFYIVSKLDGQVIDIKGAQTAPGTAINTHPKDSGEKDNQLWKFSHTNAYNYVFLESKLNKFVISIDNASKQAGSRLSIQPRGSGVPKEQLWAVLPDPSAKFDPNVSISTIIPVAIEPATQELATGFICTGSGFVPGSQVNIVYEYLDNLGVTTTNASTPPPILGNVVDVDDTGAISASLNIDTLTANAGQLTVDLYDGVQSHTFPAPFLNLTIVTAAYNGAFFTDAKITSRSA